MKHIQKLINSQLRIPRNRIEDLLKEAGADNTLSVQHEPKTDTYLESIRISGWLLIFDSENKNIDKICYVGDYSLPTDARVMEIIAKFNEDPEGFVDMFTIPDRLWRWQFHEGKLHYYIARIKWELGDGNEQH